MKERRRVDMDGKNGEIEDEWKEKREWIERREDMDGKIEEKDDGWKE